jgi:DNA-binding IclR family transcriptional regulator
MKLPETPDRPVQTVETALEIFEFIKTTDQATLTEIAEHVGLAKSTVLRHLLTLEHNGFVIRDGDEYQLGLRFLDYGIHVRTFSELYQVGRERADQLANETGGKVWLIGMENGRSIHLHRASGTHPITTDARVGQRRHLHQLAAGKAMLASLSDSAIGEIVSQYGLPKHTTNTITEQEELFEELKAVRKRGYAYNREESIEGLNSIGAAIHNANDEPIGGLSVSGPASRMQGDYFEQELPDLLLAATNEIEINLRYQ